MLTYITDSSSTSINVLQCNVRTEQTTMLANYRLPSTFLKVKRGTYIYTLAYITLLRGKKRYIHLYVGIYITQIRADVPACLQIRDCRSLLSLAGWLTSLSNLQIVHNKEYWNSFLKTKQRKNCECCP